VSGVSGCATEPLKKGEFFISMGAVFTYRPQPGCHRAKPRLSYSVKRKDAGVKTGSRADKTAQNAPSFFSLFSAFFCLERRHELRHLSETGGHESDFRNQFRLFEAVLKSLVKFAAG
jgi:hypothetical protein